MRAGLRALLLIATAGVAQAQMYDAAKAQVYYQRGQTAESLSDGAFTGWVRTIDVRYVDIWRDRWQFALDMYENATELNPAHWRAHRRAGFLYAEAAGTQANDQKAVLHLVSYLALAPEDAFADRAKTLVDRLFGRVNQRLAEDARRARGRIADVSETLMSSPTDTAGSAMTGAAGAPDAAMIGVASLPGAPPGAGAAGGMEMGGVGTAAASGPEGENTSAIDPFLPKTRPLNSLALSLEVEDMMRAAAAAQDAMGPDSATGGAARGFVVAASYGTAYVASYLGLMGEMHRFMRFLDERDIAYDPRLPQAIVGESVMRMRMLFTNTNPGSPAQFSDDHKRLAAMGVLSADDLWSPHETGKPFPAHLVDAGEMDPVEFQEELYRAAAGTLAVRVPGYEKPEEAAPAAGGAMGAPGMGGAPDMMAGMASTQPAAPSAWNQLTRHIVFGVLPARFEWLIWRNLHLARIAAAYGLESPEDVFLRDYLRLGSGEITPWVNGLLPATAVRTGALDSATPWLLAEANTP